MPYPDNFTAAAFDRRFGAAAHDRATSAAAVETVDTVAINVRIAEVLTRARAELLTIGEPAEYLARGYDWAYALEMLEDITPRLTPEAVAAASKAAQDRALDMVWGGV